METTKDAKFNVLETIEIITLFSENSKLKPELFELLKTELSLLANYLQVSPLSSLLFANAVIKEFDGGNWQKIFSHFDLEAFEILRYDEEIEMLYKKKYLRKDSHYRSNMKSLNFDFTKQVLRSVSQNKELAIEIQVFECLVDVLERFHRLCEERDDNNLDQREFINEFDDLMEKNSKYPFIHWLEKFQLDSFEMFYLMKSLWDCIDNNSNDFITDVNEIVEEYFEPKSKVIKMTQKIGSGKCQLVAQGLIETNRSEFRNNLHSKLTDQVIDFLEENEEITINNAVKAGTNSIEAKDLQSKVLFYNTEEEKAINTIMKMLEPVEFDSLQERLKKKAMPIGFCTLFYGSPGTGKTESVYQLAKASGRSIYKVDISETKSMWFGESQKLVKDIFTQYKKLVKTEKLCPILLFNEADGLISKRKAVNSSNVASTENAIQNILLEEMENFEGILFATTNLIENIDDAFERRFLFKVRFDKSTVDNGARIWQNKLEFLNHEEALLLASKFDFSGGEMENIARKCLMEEVLIGRKPTFENIINLCENEKWGSGKSHQGIGFKW